MHTICKLTNIYMYLKVDIDTSVFKYSVFYAGINLFMQVYIQRMSKYVYVYTHAHLCVCVL